MSSHRVQSIIARRVKGMTMIALHKSAARSAAAAAAMVWASTAATQALAQTPPPAGEYVCQALAPNQGLAYVDTLTLAPGDEYSLATMSGSGRYRYDPAAQALVFSSGPFAPRYVVQYVPPARGVPNIRIHEARRQSRQFDWAARWRR
jgi:hypothetical protein